MCMPKAPPPPPPALPPQAPPPMAVLAESASARPAQERNRGRSALRIDRTQSTPGAAGSGLNIPT